MTSSRRSCCPLRSALAGSAALAVTFGAAGAQAQDATTVAELRDLSIEELADIEVTSVSKRAESLSEAAAAIYVITDEDIRRSGAQTLPELLRLAPNVQVARIDAADYAISARGFNSYESANKLLVLIDGRSVYTPLQAGVDWDQHRVMTGDLARIEVVSGPGGALYGANAVNGVVNILSRSAADTQGGLLDAVVGTLDSSVSGRYGGRLGERGAYRAYAMAFQRGPMRLANGREAGDDFTGMQAGFRTDWKGARDTLTLQGDVFDQDMAETAGREGDARGGNLLARWTRRFSAESALEVQAYYDRSDRTAGGFHLQLDTVDLDVQHSFNLGPRHAFVVGGGYRVTEDDFFNFSNPTIALDPLSERIGLGNAFVQDQIALRDDLTLTLGFKLEHNSFTGLEALPSARLAWRPTETTLLWGAVSRAVRNPSRVERDLVFPGLLIDDRFEPETMIAYEAGFRGRAGSNASLSVNLFYHDYDDVRTNELSPPGVFPVFVGNGIRGRTIGLEAWADYAVSDWWRLSGGLSLIDKAFEVKPGALDFSAFEGVGADPDAVIKLRSQMDLSDRLRFDLRLRGYSEAPALVAGEYVGAAAYLEAEARLAYQASDQVELSLSGMNLLADRHREASETRGREIPRSVNFELRWTY